MPARFPLVLRALPRLLLALISAVTLLTACDSMVSSPFIASAHARKLAAPDESSPVAFSPPTAEHCRRWPSLREVAGDVASSADEAERWRGEDKRSMLSRRDALPADWRDAYLTRSHHFTHDLASFQSALAQAQAAGGGDTPEALNEALHETVHGLRWRSDAVRLVVLVADASPHLEYCTTPPAQQAVCPLYDRDMQAALVKGIKLFTVGASGLDPSGEFIFRQMAQCTAGRFVFLTYQNAQQPASGPGGETVHDVKQYSVQTLDKLIVRLVGDELAQLTPVLKPGST